MRWAVDVARVGKRRDIYRVLVGKREVNRPLGRPGRRWVSETHQVFLITLQYYSEIFNP